MASGAVSAPSSASVSPAGSGRALTNNPVFHSDLLAIAKSYDGMSRADGTWWAPADCRAPTHPGFLSKADSGPHDRKIYTLFAKDIDAYAAVNGTKLKEPDPKKRFSTASTKELAGFFQIIVKEAWTPIEAANRDACNSKWRGFVGPVTTDGKTFYPCEQAGLFVMYKPKSNTPGTDDGWVYGSIVYEKVTSTQNPGAIESQTKVTSSGRVETCMGCHEQAPHGRLFGLPG